MKSEKKDEICQHAAIFHNALRDVITNEESDFYIDIKQRKDLTPIVTGMCMGFLKFVRKMTRGNGNFLDDISMVNKIIVQFLMEFGELKK